VLKNCSNFQVYLDLSFQLSAMAPKQQCRRVHCFLCFDLRMLFDKLSNLRRGHRAGLTRYFDAVLEQRHRRIAET